MILIWNSRENLGLLYLSSHHSTESTNGFSAMEFQHLIQREVTTDISIHDEEWLWIARQNLVTEMIQTTSCTQGSVFLKISKKRRFSPSLIKELSSKLLEDMKRFRRLRNPYTLQTVQVYYGDNLEHYLGSSVSVTYSQNCEQYGRTSVISSYAYISGRRNEMMERIFQKTYDTRAITPCNQVNQDLRLAPQLRSW